MTLYTKLRTYTLCILILVHVARVLPRHAAKNNLKGTESHHQLLMQHFSYNHVSCSSSQCSYMHAWVHDSERLAI